MKKQTPEINSLNYKLVWRQILKFRKDLNGLRAIAVIAVVIFHFNAEWLPGGFAGVDVFFVISGYLMTAIIITGLKNDSFSLSRFYISRAKRIVPALALLSVALLSFGWFFLSPLDYEKLGKHVTSSITFVSNIVYWQEAGYFDTESSQKWMLHTWSLSVEWQFYLLYPVILLFLKRFLSLKHLSLIIVVGTIFGFFLNIYITNKAPSMSFYLLFTRAWEMMLGGVAFLYPIQLNKRASKFIEIMGLIMISFSFLFISEHNVWPGHLAALPVLGTYLVIFANKEESFFTSNLFFQKLGSWSYSIYLWHWPIVVGYAKYSPSSSPLVGITLSIILGWFSYKLIESNKSLTANSKRNLAMYIFLLCSAYACYQSIGFSNIRLSSQEKIILEEAIIAINDWDYPKEDDYFDKAGIRTIKGNKPNLSPNLFVGDSLMEQYYPKVEQFVKNEDMPTSYFFTQGGCMPLEGMSRPGKACDKLPKVTTYIEGKHFNAIYIGGYWDHYINDNSPYRLGDLSFAKQADRELIQLSLASIIQTLKNHADKVFILLPTPHREEFNPQFMVELGNINSPEKRVSVKEIRDQFFDLYTFLEPIVNNIDINTIDPINYICQEDYCNTYNDDGIPYYKDSIHMRPWYVKKYANYLIQE